MFNSIVQSLVNCIAACLNWLDSLLGSMAGSLDFLFAGVVIFLVSRFLLGPLIGGISRGSDKAKPKDKEEDA